MLELDQFIAFGLEVKNWFFLDFKLAKFRTKTTPADLQSLWVAYYRLGLLTLDNHMR
jgi:hypothetical protein